MTAAASTAHHRHHANNHNGVSGPGRRRQRIHMAAYLLRRRATFWKWAMDAVEQLRAHEAECAKRYEAITVQLGEIKVRLAETRAEMAEVKAEMAGAKAEMKAPLAEMKAKLDFHDKMLWAVLGVVLLTFAKDAIAPLVG